MKKYLIATAVILIASAFIVIPALRKGNPVEPPVVEEFIPAQFGFQENLAVVFNETVTLPMEIREAGIERVELKYNDQVIQTWKAPKKGEQLSYDFNPTILGSKRLDLYTVMKDGKSFVDNRVMRTLSDIQPELLTADIVETYPHDMNSFTQGLEFYEGRLFESTGQYGQSEIFEVDLKTGKRQPDFKIGLDATYFGEGITILNDTIYQLTWKSGKCFTYTLGDHIQSNLKDFNYAGEGWGLCNDGKSLIMSDGTERLTFRNPKTFEIERTLEVYTHINAIPALNELEYYDGKIYANIWQSDVIIVIDPENGRVLQSIDCSSLASAGRGTRGEVLNGITFNATNGKPYLTGKNWARLFEVAFVKPNA